MLEESVPQVEQNQWIAVALRLTAFRATPVDIEERDWWSSLLVEHPEEQLYKPNIHELRQVGLIDIGQLILTTNPAVIEWRIVPNNPQQPPVDGFPFPNLGDWDNALGYFLSLMLPWLKEQSPDLQRIAFGAELLLPTESHTGNYEKLAHYLSIRFDEDSSDFMFQINRRRDARIDIPTLRMNRFSKWRSVKSSVGAMVGQQPFDLPGLDRYACHLELDINTTPDFQGVLTREHLPQVFEELVDLGQEIKDRGDV